MNNDGLKLGMNETKLNTQINKQINNSTTVTNKMNSWVLKAASDKDAEKAGKTINNTDNDVTFDVETGQGLTVARNGATIKYGVNNTQLVKNINDGDTAVTNISAKFSVTDGTNTKAVNLGKDKNNNVKFLGTADETTVTVGGNDDAPTVTVGLAQAFKDKVTKNATDITNLTTRVNANSDNIAANTEKIGKNTTAIGENKTAIGENTKAIAAKMTSWKLKAEGVEGEEEIKDGNAVTFDVAAKDQGLTVTRNGSIIKYGIEGSKIDISENETVKKLSEKAKKHTSVKAGDYVTVDEGTNEAGGKEYTVKGPDITVSNNLKIEDKTNNEGKKVGYEISLNKDISVDNVTVKEKLTAKTVDTETVNAGTVKASDKITVGEGDTVTIDKDGLTIKDGPSVTTKGITNVKDGKNDTDAVNVRQLNALANQSNQNIAILGGKVGELDNRVNRVGAGAAALAALHPLDFDPYNRSQIMAGVSTYKGQQAIALGIAHYSNENTLVHVGLSYAGESDLMANVGISYKFGSEEDKKHLDERNKKLPQYKDGPISSVYILQDEVKQLIEENNGMKKEIEELKEKNAKEINELKAVIKEIQNKA